MGDPRLDYFCTVQQEKEKLVFENEAFFGYFDDKPINIGHLLIISKRHIDSLFEFNTLEQNLFYPSLIDARKILEKKFNPDGFNLAINEGVVAGKIMHHVVIHFIPRYKNDFSNPVASGARSVRGLYISPAKPSEKFPMLTEIPSLEDLKKQYYNPNDPNKRFYLGMKVLLRNDEGKILVLRRQKGHQFIGQVDLPGGRCEDRDKEELRAVQREVFEEIGVNVTNLSFFDTYIFWDMQFPSDNNDNPSIRTGLIIYLYLANLPMQKTVKIVKKREFLEKVEWMWPSELAEILNQYPLRIRQKIKMLESRD